MSTDESRPSYGEQPTEPDPLTDSEWDRTGETPRSTETTGTTDRVDTTGTTEPVEDTGSHRIARSRPAEPVTTRSSMGSRHLSSILLSLILTPIGLIALDYSAQFGWLRNLGAAVDEPMSLRSGIATGIAGAVFLIVGALSRASALGPLLAGLVWGALPAVALALVPGRFVNVVADLPDVYDGFGQGIAGAASMAFPVIGGLMIGAGLFGRWRGRQTTALPRR